MAELKYYLIALAWMIMVFSVGKSHALSASTGTGWFVTNDGYMVTANHVVEGTSDVYVMLDGQLYKAQVVATDRYNDIAIIKTPFSTTRAVPLSLSSKYSSEQAVMIGYPAPNYLGISTKYQYEIASTGYLTSTTVYVSGSICPGNSGSPVIDRYGNSLGVTKAAYTFYIYDNKTECSSEGIATKSIYVLDLLNKLKVIVPFINNTTKSLLEWAKYYKNSVLLIYTETK